MFAAFAKEAAERMGKADWAIDDRAVSRLRHHDWPGNVRELRNFAVDMVLDVAAPGPTLRAEPKPLADRVAEYEASEIRAALAASKGRVAPVLAMLGLPRKTLYDKMKRLGISPGDHK